MIRYHQHYHAHSIPGQARLTICWAEDDGAKKRDRELLINGSHAAAIIQRLLHCPDDDHRLMVLETVIEGETKCTP